jgi:hypothetical protein
MNDAVNKAVRKEHAVLVSESKSTIRSEYSPAIEGLQEWLRLQVGTSHIVSRERRRFREGRIEGLREAVIWLKKLEAAAVVERAERAGRN